MKLYYHQTDGGAEYYSTENIPGTDEGSLNSVIMRTDGGEIEIYTAQLEKLNIKLIIQ